MWRWSATPTCSIRKTPSITTMLRGLVGEEIEITAANKDLHSGMYGNAARNPNQVLAEIIASLRNPDGSVAIAGFYDDVAEVDPVTRASWDKLGFDGAAFLKEAGLSIPAGEQSRSVLEQTWSRPTCEINGMIGGYTGEGFKTVIPAKASAKISFRLVSGMNPDKIRAAFREHVRARVPADCSVTFTEHGGSPAVSVPTDGPHLAKARAALTGEWGRECALQRRRADQFPWPAISSASSGSIRSSSASPMPTTAFTRPTRSTTSRASTRGSAPGSASWLRSPRDSRSGS